jgi:integrase
MPRRRLPQNAYLPIGLSPHGRKFRARDGEHWKTFEPPLENAIAAYKAWRDNASKHLIGTALDTWAFDFLPVSVASKQLKARTMKDYHADIAPLKAGIGHIPVAALTPAHCATLRDTLHAEKGGHARNIMACLGSFMRWCVETGRRHDNPTKLVRQLPQSQSSRLVTDAEFSAVYEHAPPMVRIAMTIGLRTAARPADILKLGPQHVRDGKLWFDQNKTENAVCIALIGDLARIVNDHLSQSIVYPTFVHTRGGNAYTVDGFAALMRKAKLDAGIEDAFGLSQLRPKAATDVYQSTSDVKKVMALTGHKTEAQALRYIRQYVPQIAEPNQKKLLYIAKLG